METESALRYLYSASVYVISLTGWLPKGFEFSEADYIISWHIVGDRKELGEENDPSLLIKVFQYAKISLSDILRFHLQ